jgi:hypothetical protein
VVTRVGEEFGGKQRIDRVVEYVLGDVRQDWRVVRAE